MPKKTPTSLPKPVSLWQTIGPSFILLGLALGSGELILWPYLSAQWGLGLLWGALLGITFQYFLNTEIMRYSLYWGESVFVGFWRLSRLLPIWFILSTFIPWSLPGFSSASGEIFSTLLPFLPDWMMTYALLLLTGVLLSAGSTVYATMEKFQKTVILIGLPLIFAIALYIVDSSAWVTALEGLVGVGDGWRWFPSGVGLTSFLGAFAYSGAGGNLNLAQSYYIKEKGFGMGKYMPKVSSLFSGSQAVSLEGVTFVPTKANRSRWDAWWRLVQVEHAIVFWFLGLVSIVVLSVLSYATVYGQEVSEGLAFVYTQALVIGQLSMNIFGTAFLFIAGVMLFSTQMGVLESSSRIISENVLLLFHKPKKKASITSGFYVALWAQILFGAIIYAAGVQEPRYLLTLSAVLNAAAMMMSFLFIYLLNRKRLSKDFRPGFFRSTMLLLAFLFFVLFVTITVPDFLQSIKEAITVSF